MNNDLNEKEYLKIENFPILNDYFTYEEKFQSIVDSKIKVSLLGEIKTELLKIKLEDESKKYSLSSFETIDKQANIGPLSTIEFLVESTYYSNFLMRDSMVIQTNELEKYIFRWRPTHGDGNCFYRSVLFEFLENTIFECEISLLIYLIVDLNEIFTKIDKKYFDNFKNLINVEKAISILYIIYEKLDSITNKNRDEKIKESYEILIKSFNHNKQFDLTMIFYLRAKLFELIESNKEKYYTPEFEVKIGNLLPMEYETETGEFLYDKFYTEDLFKNESYAEKITVYLVPFILRRNLKIIYFDFGDFYQIEEKVFNFTLDDKSENEKNETKPYINVIYRKLHYDMAYEKSYFEMFTKFICRFVNFNEDLKVLSEKVMNNFRNGISLESNYDKNISDASINQYNQSNQKSSQNQKNINNNNNNNSNNTFQTFNIFCSYCSTQTQFWENNLSISSCKSCFNKEINNIIQEKFIKVLTHNKDLYKNDKIEELFENLNQLRTENIEVFGQLISLIEIRNLNFKNIIDEVDVIMKTKSEMCSTCFKILSSQNKGNNNSSAIKICCGCSFCGLDCLEEYFKIVTEDNLIEKKLCYCGTIFSQDSILEIINEKAAVKQYMLKCMFCLRDKVDIPKSITLKMKHKEKSKPNLFKIEPFEHLICSSCMDLYITE